MEFRGKDVGNPNTWGFFGGGIEKDETPMQAASRELWEEASFAVDSFDCVTKLNEKPLVWLFLKVVDEEFIPTLSWESNGYAWLSSFPKKHLHPKLGRHLPWLKRSLELLREQ
jgi:8-oxo-dGTP pyrophosphatase MutT (NUDIX family)